MAADQSSRVQHRQWICQQLKSVLGFIDVDGIADHMLYTIGDRDELVLYCREIIGDDSPAFTDELANRLFPKQHNRRRQQKQPTAPDPNRGKGVIVRKVQSNKAKKKNTRSRTICDCYGTEHDVFSNCLTCGRIMCVAESEGGIKAACPSTCFFCGSTVYKDYTEPAAAEVIQRKEQMLQNQQAMAFAKVIDDQEPALPEDLPSQPELGTIALNLDAIQGYANCHLSGQAQRIYDLLHASLGRKKNEQNCD